MMICEYDLKDGLLFYQISLKTILIHSTSMFLKLGLIFPFFSKQFFRNALPVIVGSNPVFLVQVSFFSSSSNDPNEP